MATLLGITLVLSLASGSEPLTQYNAVDLPGSTATEIENDSRPESEADQRATEPITRHSPEELVTLGSDDLENSRLESETNKLVKESIERYTPEELHTLAIHDLEDSIVEPETKRMILKLYDILIKELFVEIQDVADNRWMDKDQKIRYLQAKVGKAFHEYPMDIIEPMSMRLLDEAIARLQAIESNKLRLVLIDEAAEFFRRRTGPEASTSPQGLLPGQKFGFKRAYDWMKNTYDWLFSNDVANTYDNLFSNDLETIADDYGTLVESTVDFYKHSICSVAGLTKEYQHQVQEFRRKHKHSFSANMLAFNSVDALVERIRKDCREALGFEESLIIIVRDFMEALPPEASIKDLRIAANLVIEAFFEDWNDYSIQAVDGYRANMARLNAATGLKNQILRNHLGGVFLYMKALVYKHRSPGGAVPKKRKKGDVRPRH